MPNVFFPRLDGLLLILNVVGTIARLFFGLTLSQTKRTGAEVLALVPALVPVHAAFLKGVLYLGEAQGAFTLVLTLEISCGTDHCQQWHCKEVDFH